MCIQSRRWGRVGGRSIRGDRKTRRGQSNRKKNLALASQLLHGLESPVYEISEAEVASRLREAQADPSVLITFDQLVAGLRHRGR